MGSERRIPTQPTKLVHDRTWRLDTPVVTFADAERHASHTWSIRDSFEGVQVFGATGSGKTSGSGRALAMGLLQAGFGGLVLTAKPTDAEDWAGPDGYMARARRPDRPVVVGPPSRWNRYEDWGVAVPLGGHHLDFLDYEFNRLSTAGVNPSFNLVALFETALDVGRPQEPGSSSEPFWQDTFRQLLQNAIDLAAIADGAVSLVRVKDIIMTAPMTREEANSQAWKDAGGACWECLQKAQARFDHGEPPPFYDEEDLRQLALYWLVDLAGLAWKTRSNIVTMFTSKADFLLRSPLRQIFGAQVDSTGSRRPSTCAPDLTHSGRVVILDFPVKSFGEIGRFVQVLYKTLWQMSTEDRDVHVDHRSGVVSRQAPVFLWADESQYFVTVRDLAFQLTARSKCAATVYLTQNLPNYYAMLKGADNRSTADSLVGNLQTKIFHANGDPVTNEWAERCFGSGVGTLKHRSQSLTGDRTSGKSESISPVVPSREFVTLRTGGLRHGQYVDAIVLQAGRAWTSGEEVQAHVLHTSFPQHSASRTPTDLTP